MRFFNWRSGNDWSEKKGQELEQDVHDIEKIDRQQWNIPMDEFVPRPPYRIWRVGAFIDVQNIYMCVKSVFGHTKINYRILRDFLTRDGAMVKMVAFTCYDPENRSQVDFMHALALMGYRVVAKPLKKMPDGNIKASMDMEMALEIIVSAHYLDEIVLVTGDGDFAPIVDYVARMNKFVKVIGPDRLTSPELIRSCDQFINLAQIEGIFVVD
ncbi:MAG: NYN domain-containing protein [Armatimonadota bacterium]|nr:NYN domain-containing protein [Armatimonadota bacterium]